MKKTTLCILGLALSVSFFTGCEKEKKQDAITPVVTNTSLTVKEFIENNSAKKQPFTINVTNVNDTIVGSLGTKVIFPSNAFVTQGGQAVTGEITIQLIEIFDKAAMLLSDRPTTSDGQLLVSGGEIFIGATANGQELKLVGNRAILVELQAVNVDKDMTLFTGALKDDQFNWTAVPDVVASPKPFSFNDSTWYMQDIVRPTFYYNPSSYIFTSTKLGWLNCDAVYYSPTPTTISIVCRGVVDDNNTRAYLVYKNINSVANVWEYAAGTFTSAHVPIGEVVTVIVFSLKDGKQYVDAKEVTITSNMHISMNLVEASESEIIALIKEKCN